MRRELEALVARLRASDDPDCKRAAEELVKFDQQASRATVLEFELEALLAVNQEIKDAAQAIADRLASRPKDLDEID